MSANAKLRKQAARFEQDRQYDKALQLYARLLAEPQGAEDEQDVALFNRVGDLALRQGDVPLAVQHYERAIAVYAAGGMHGNAIAVCNKILRHAPQHAPAHYTLGILSARKGFRANAARHLADYAARMLAFGRADEALKGLGEYADIVEDGGDDPYSALEEELAHPSRDAATVTRLRELVAQLRENRPAPAAAATRAAAPGDAAERAPSRPSSDLVFLDVYDDTPVTAPVAGFESTAWDTTAPAAEREPSLGGDVAPSLDDLPMLGVDDELPAPRPALAALADTAPAAARAASPLATLPGELPPLRLAHAEEARARHAAGGATAASVLDLPVLDDAAFAPAAGTAPARDVSPLVDLLDEPAPRALDASSTPSSAHGHAAPVERVDDTYVDLASWLAEDEGPKTTRMTADEAFETGDESGDFDRMLSTFRDGVARTLDADDYQAHYDMGLAFRGMGLLDDAISEFQKAVRAPNRPLRTVEALGECFLERGQPQVALTVLERGLASTPAAAPADDALLGVLYFLGRAQEALDRPAEALGCYQRVLATDIQFRDAAERLAQLTRTTR